jgi:hypothetical protein
MCVCVFLCLCCPVFRQRPCGELITAQGVLPSVNDKETEKSALCSKVGARGGGGETGRALLPPVEEVEVSNLGPQIGYSNSSSLDKTTVSLLTYLKVSFHDTQLTSVAKTVPFN